jgi:hypothetical protein
MPSNPDWDVWAWAIHFSIHAGIKDHNGNPWISDGIAVFQIYPEWLYRFSMTATKYFK